ncbi:MAG: YbaB/EbfC family nucleoid-associated protein [Clostridia bacterium]|jgi:DNA-binding YbaB/EbfC family protein|nr:YbaB/EbfC family nucleoid-associated protein [Clostridia bacterium]
MGGMNMNNLMRQAQKMQKKMEETQASLADKTIDITSGGGAVKITITGKKEIKSIKINPEVVDPEDVEMLEDLVLSAVNEAIRQADELANGEMGKITGGVGNGMF